MCHEVCDSFEHAAWFEDEGGQGDAGQVGAGTQLADDVREDVALLGGDDGLVLVGVFLAIEAAAGAAQAVFAVPVPENHDCFSGGCVGVRSARTSDAGSGGGFGTLWRAAKVSICRYGGRGVCNERGIGGKVGW